LHAERKKEMKEGTSPRFFLLSPLTDLKPDLSNLQRQGRSYRSSHKSLPQRGETRCRN
jgi:hypothetical protein